MNIRKTHETKVRGLIDDFYDRCPPKRFSRFFVKKKAVFLRKGGTFVHGIDKSAWDDISPRDGDVFIFEADIGTLLVCSIDRLRNSIDNSVPANAAVGFDNGMVFWQRKTFRNA